MSSLRDCRLCSRLVEYRKAQQSSHPDYFNLPVPGFGDAGARLLIVGLAPGLHGANAIGIPFTGDSSGTLLFACLQRAGFASHADSNTGAGGMRLHGCRITNAVKCVPPQNRPIGSEITACNRYLRAEIDALPRRSVLLALGAIAHRAILNALDLRCGEFRFQHAAEFALADGSLLIDSYHPSRYNQNTGRLTPPMLARVFERIEVLLHG